MALDFLVKWYLRLIALIWLSLFLYNAFSNLDSFEYFYRTIIWYLFLLPFNLDLLPAMPNFVEPNYIFQIVFWTWWLITGTRFHFTGKHFYQ